MRDPQEAQNDRAKRSQRQWLFTLILAASPCLAQEPENGGLGVLPPLPLNTNTMPSNADTRASAVRNNPYVASENESAKAAVGQTWRSAQLSPIGAAIGLNPIGAGQSITQPADRDPIMIIEPAHVSTVQLNPLLQSVHRQNNDLVEAKLAPVQPVSHSAPPLNQKGSKPGNSAGEASILVVTPAKKPLLVVKPQTAVVPPTAVQPRTAVTQPTKASIPATATDAKLLPAKVTTDAIQRGTDEPSPTPPTTATAKTEKQSPNMASVAKAKQKVTADKRVEGASIAAMLGQNPQTAVAALNQEKAAPIFFSLSDSTEIAPSKEALPQNETINLSDPDTTKAQPGKPLVPLKVTVREDGSIITTERQKPTTSASRKNTIPKPILAETNQLGIGLGLPAPTSLPKAISSPKQLPTPSSNAKQITPNGKSILSTAGPSSSGEHEKLSVAPVKNFRPRTVLENARAIKPAKPFSIFGEKAKPMDEAQPLEKTASTVAPSTSVAEPDPTTEPDDNKLTLPTPVSISNVVASPKSNDKSGRSVMKVESVSSKIGTKKNPHAEVANTGSKSELLNPFNRQRNDHTAAPEQQKPPETEKMNQVVRVEKFKLSKDRPRVPVNLESVLETEKNAKQVPIASGVVAPIALPESVEPKPASAGVATAKPATTITPQKTSSTPKKPTADVNAATPASIVTNAKNPLVKEPKSNADEPSGTTILRKRYRPPVAVQAIPGTVTRQNPIASKTAPKVQAVPEMVIDVTKTQPPAPDLQQGMRLDTASELKDRGLILGPDVKLTQLHMNQAQVRSLTLGGSVRGMRVGDKGVCQAFASGPNQLKLIGTGIGTTRLVVWAQNNGKDDEVLMRAFEIHVDEFVPSEGNSIESTTVLLNQSIQKVFPQSQAKVQLVRGELWVTGTCESQESAEKILRMVRKSCLIPVRDQLTVK